MKRAKKILLWTGISLAATIAILLICAACYNWILGSRLEKRLAAIKAAGDPICLADLARPAIPPEQNGATYLRRAKDDLEAMDKACVDWKYDEKEDRYYTEEIPRIEEALNAYPAIYALLEKTAAAADFDFQADLTQLPHDYLDQSLANLALIRSTARYLDERVEVLLSKGERDQAIQSAILTLQLTRQLERDRPIMVTYMMSLAMKQVALKDINRTLQAGPVSEQSRDALAAELPLHGSTDILKNVLSFERVCSLDYVRREFPRPWILSNRWQLGLLYAFDGFIDISRLPSADRAIQECGALKTSSSRFDIPAQLTLPAFQQFMLAAYRSRAKFRAVRIINALEQKTPGNGDKTPTVAELGLPDEVGVDPFNGKQMIIKKLPEGWLVYSVGENLTDNGGRIEDRTDGPPLDVGFGPKTAKQQLQDKEPTR
jgi:hypothetical protein